MGTHPNAPPPSTLAPIWRHPLRSPKAAAPCSPDRRYATGDSPPTVDRPPSSGPWNCSSKRCRARSEEHTSELQSLRHLVCRLLLEKKNNHRETSLSWRSFAFTRHERRGPPEP